MLLNEPNRTNYDWEFTLLGFPVRVSPFFLLMPIFLGMGVIGSSDINAGVAITILILVFFVSILVHELGHALAYRYFGLPARIVLYWMGGLAISDGGGGSAWGGGGYSRSLSPNQKIIVSLAGPGAGFLLALLIIGFIYGMGGTVHYQQQGIIPVVSPDLRNSVVTEVGRLVGDGSTSRFPVGSNLEMDDSFVFMNGEQLTANEYRYVDDQLEFGTVPDAGADIRIRQNNPMMNLVFWLSLWSTIFINIMNLAPVYPLDGGQVTRELFTQSDQRNGLRYSFITSIAVAGLIAVVSFMSGDRFLGFFFGIMAYSNYVTLQQMGGGFGGGYGGGRPW